VYSKNLEDHIKHLDDVLSRLDKNGFCISRDKITLGRNKVKWLGFIISDKGVQPDDEKVKKILGMRRPSTAKELRSALGMWTYFASFIPGYSIITDPLRRLLETSRGDLRWTPECEQAWNQIKTNLANAPIMGFPDYNLPLYLHTDACKSGYAAILTQEQKGRQVLIDAASRTTSNTEKNYSSAKLECACVIWAAKKWKHHLHAAKHTVIITDSYGLQYLQQKGTRSALMIRWLWEMEGFNYTVVYRTGNKNIADYLSRQWATMAVSTRSQGADTRIDYAELNEGRRCMKPVHQDPTEMSDGEIVSDQDIESEDESMEESDSEVSKQQNITQEQQERDKNEIRPGTTRRSVADIGSNSKVSEEKNEVWPNNKEGQLKVRRSKGESKRPDTIAHLQPSKTADRSFGITRGSNEEKNKEDRRLSTARTSEEVLGNEESQLEGGNKGAPQGSTESEVKAMNQDSYDSITVDVLIQEQRKDVYIRRIWTIAQGGTCVDVTRTEMRDAEDITQLAGIIVKIVKTSTGERKPKIIVPQSLQKRMVTLIHRATHAGITGTWRALQREHWFHGMKQVVKRVVKSCPDCLAVKGRPRIAETLAPDKRPPALGDVWHIDGLKLPLSQGYDHLIVATDTATKYIVLTKATGETAKAAAETIMEITSRFGPPKRVVSDRGRAFLSEAVELACRDLYIKFDPVGAQQPQANGEAERTNRTLLEILTTLCRDREDQWAQHVPEAAYIINTRISSATNYSPYELVYGRQPPGPSYVAPIREAERGGRKESELVHNLRNRIARLQELAHENQIIAGKQQAAYHDAHAKAHEFKVNDTVYVYKQSSTTGGVTSKINYHWRGPYYVKSQIGPKTYYLMDEKGKQLPGTYHARDLNKVEAAPHSEGRQV